MELIGKGAEANIFLDNAIVKKVRVSKKYRLEVIDFGLRKKRTRLESRILQKVGSIGPGFLSGDDVQEIHMNFVEGDLVKHVLDENVSLARTIGVVVGRIHDLGVVHGDLTTSNMILSTSGDLKIIDFGLSFVSDKIEDKAVDLHLFKEAVKSKHYRFENEIWNEFVQGYSSKNKIDILNRLDVVESRGRNKLKD